MRLNLRCRLSAGGAVAAALVALASASATPSALAATTCNLGPGGSIHHVIYIQYDNTHLTRDNQSVPSDLQQVPALKDFLTGNGSLLSNDHTILISHTAGGIISSLTGLYPDRNGIGVSNSYGVFKPDGSIDQFAAPAFTYWTDPATVLDPLPNLITTGQKNTPAPWVPFTRAGCDTGAFSIANMELENTRTTAAGDITKVFGQGSPEWNFAASATVNSTKKVTDFEGIAIHCSQASSAAGQRCGPSHGGKPDLLPAEPGGYTGFNALFGAPYANQVVNQPGGFQASTADADGTANGFNDLAPAVNDVFDFSHTPGPATCSVAPDPGACPAPQPIATGGVNGFPGFSPSAAQTLGYVASMQESGIPVTYAYIRDSHDNHEQTGACGDGTDAQGPGTACYVQQLHNQETAYRAFFNRLAADGINKSNTMFVFTVDEGDHYAGGPPTNPGCDGVTVACTYTPGMVGPNTVGEIATNLNQLVSTSTGDTTPFNIHFDSAPTVYVPNSPNGPPPPTDPKVRNLEREMRGLTVTNPRTGNVDAITQHIADKATQDILHMDNTDPLRTPSFTLFGNADYFFSSFCATGADTTKPGCPSVGPGFAWIHGDDNPEIARTWVGMVGPNVRTLGETPSVWTDHTDVRPTMLAALGLTDDYTNDGNVVSQVLASAALPPAVQGNVGAYQALEAAQKQINAPFGRFGHDAETVSTTAVATTSPQTYAAWDSQLVGCKQVRDGLAAQIQAILAGAAGGTGFDPATANSLTAQANGLLGEMDALAALSAPPAGSACSAPGPHPSTTVVGCAPASVRVGQATTCTATVTGSTHPARSVTFASSSGGAFGPSATCTLVVIGGDQSRCSATFTPAAVGSGTATISADYAGDATDATSHGSTAVAVTAGLSATAVACAPGSVAKGTASTCTVTVSSAAGAAPTGQVTVARGSSGAFGATTCTLVAGAGGSSSCSVDYTPAVTGVHKIYANYPGDADHLPSHGSTTITAS